MAIKIVFNCFRDHCQYLQVFIFVNKIACLQLYSLHSTVTVFSHLIFPAAPEVVNETIL